MSFANAAGDIAVALAEVSSFRQVFGSPVTFKIPTTPTWPGGTAINPDTNTPYDALTVRTNAEFTTVVVTCLIIEKQGSPLRPQSDVRFEAGGLFESMDVILDVDAADYATIAAASAFTVNGVDYTLEETKPFSLGGTLYRYLIYGAQD